MVETIPFSAIRKKWMLDPEFRRLYEANALAQSVADAVMTARRAADLTQQDLATRMGTSRTAVARLEGGNHLPSLSTLRKVATATGRAIELRVEPLTDSTERAGLDEAAE